jgi:hypothetical protein
MVTAMDHSATSLRVMAFVRIELALKRDEIDSEYVCDSLVRKFVPSYLMVGDAVKGNRTKICESRESIPLRLESTYTGTTLQGY